MQTGRLRDSYTSNWLRGLHTVLGCSLTLLLYGQGVELTEAKWETRYSALAGSFVYFLESNTSRSKKTYHSYATHYVGMIVR